VREECHIIHNNRRKSEDIVAKYETYYQDQPFVTVTTTGINMKQVVQTNKCIISLMKKGNRLLITSVIDNLTKELQDKPYKT
jgi:N-acetyl-gamma-glutamyl-phosphate reductase